LPLPDRLKDQLKSDIADMRNTGETKRRAADRRPLPEGICGYDSWVPRSTSRTSGRGQGYGALTKGGTGFAVATIVEYLTRARGPAKGPQGSVTGRLKGFLR